KAHALAVLGPHRRERPARLALAGVERRVYVHELKRLRREARQQLEVLAQQDLAAGGLAFAYHRPERMPTLRRRAARHVHARWRPEQLTAHRMSRRRGATQRSPRARHPGRGTAVAASAVLVAALSAFSALGYGERLEGDGHGLGAAGAAHARAAGAPGMPVPVLIDARAR